MLKFVRKWFPTTDFEIFVLDSADFGGVGHRVRIYGVMVDLRRCYLEKPVAKWEADLNSFAEQFQGKNATITDILLPDDAEEVVSLYAAIAKTAEKQDKKDGCKWVEEHEQVRATLRHMLCLVVPDEGSDEMRSYLHGWEDLLPRRERDVLALHGWVCLHVCGFDRKRVRLLWNATLSVGWPQPKTPDKYDSLSSIMRHHRYIVTDLGRPLTGKELLMAQGFPKNMCTKPQPAYDGPDDMTDVMFGGGDDTIISDYVMSGLAGNTMGVSVVGAVQIACLANADVTKTMGRPPNHSNNTGTDAIFVGNALKTAFFKSDSADGAAGSADAAEVEPPSAGDAGDDSWHKMFDFKTDPGNWKVRVSSRRS